MLESLKNAIAHFDGSLKRRFLAAILAVGEVLGKLIPLAADAKTPALERSCFVRIAGDITLSQDCVFWVVEMVEKLHVATECQTNPFEAS